MRIVTRQAIANRRRMNLSFDLRGIFIGVAREAEFVRSRGNQLYVGDVFVCAYFMAAHAPHSHGGMHGLTFGFVFVAGQAGGRIGLGIKRHRVLRR